MPINHYPALTQQLWTLIVELTLLCPVSLHFLYHGIFSLWGQHFSVYFALVNVLKVNGFCLLWFDSLRDSDESYEAHSRTKTHRFIRIDCAWNFRISKEPLGPSKVGFTDHQHQHCWELVGEVNPLALNKKLWVWGPVIWVLTSFPDDSDDQKFENRDTRRS